MKWRRIRTHGNPYNLPENLITQLRIAVVEYIFHSLFHGALSKLY